MVAQLDLAYMLEGAFCDKQLSGEYLINLAPNVMPEILKLVIFHLSHSLMKKGVLF